jgi:hypothetical protein
MKNMALTTYDSIYGQLRINNRDGAERMVIAAKVDLQTGEVVALDGLASDQYDIKKDKLMFTPQAHPKSFAVERPKSEKTNESLAVMESDLPAMRALLASVPFKAQRYGRT